MNRPLQKFGNTIIGVFIAIMCVLTYIQYIKGPELQKNPDNSRIVYDEYSRRRGQISAGREVIAYSQSAHDYLRQLRSYPDAHAEAFAPITGYYSIWYGRTGLEYSQNSILAGSDPRLFGTRFLEEIAGRDPRGGSISTTINPLLQVAAYNAFSSECGSQTCKGAAVAIDPETGKILAIVTAPSFDPNNLVTNNRHIAERYWKSYSEDVERPLINRALQINYPAQGIFNIIPTAIALDQGIAPNILLDNTPQYSTQNFPNSPEEPDPTRTQQSNDVHCGPDKNTSVALSQALEYSCTNAIVDLLQHKIVNPLDKIHDLTTKLGIDAPTFPLPLPHAISTIGTPTNLSELITSISKNSIALTPFTNAVIAATIANGGTIMQPYLIDTVERPDLSVLESFAPRKHSQAFSQETAQKITQIMQTSEEHTIGYQKTNYTISSALTVLRKNDNSLGSNTWYLAFANDIDKKIALAVFVENDGDPNENDTHGDSEALAAKIGRIMIKVALGGM